jgi:hypothetical protein
MTSSRQERKRGKETSGRRPPLKNFVPRNFNSDHDVHDSHYFHYRICAINVIMQSHPQQ